MRIALHSIVRPGDVDAYREHHARIPADLEALFGRAGITEWAIWRSGDRLFHLVECEDFDEAMRIVGSDQANTAWQADIGRFVAAFHGPDGEDAFTPLEQIWSLSDQRTSETS
jgi:L-rhamnose mutarotase